jgi:hypothetical protein
MHPVSKQNQKYPRIKRLGLRVIIRENKAI